MLSTTPNLLVVSRGLLDPIVGNFDDEPGDESPGAKALVNRSEGNDGDSTVRYLQSRFSFPRFAAYIAVFPPASRLFQFMGTRLLSGSGYQF